MSTYLDKPLSLIERKKQQWAKEKEELAGLTAPWSKDSQAFHRNRNVPKLTMPSDFFPVRRSSLPPLYKNQYNSSFDKGGETSGYGSDNPNQNNWAGYESSSSYKDDRPKWKDKKNVFDSNENDPPSWVKRGLQRDEEIVVSNMSPAESPQQEEELERPPSSSHNYKTFIRGQNIPVDSTELAERERRREIARAHQEAVRKQLEEREKRREEERQKRIQEEKEEELRIEREQEQERKRQEEEQRAMRDKQERERKRKEAIEEALELAEREAKALKQKKKQNVAVEVIHNDLEEKKSNVEKGVLNNEKSLTPRVQSPKASFQVLSPEMALVMQTPLEVLQNMQYVLLNNNAIPIAIPLTLEKRTDRVLTPTKNKTLCDSSTQTEPVEEMDSCTNNHKYIREKLTNLELNYDNRTRKGRSRSDDRSLEEKPKWGANRPPTRYMKQSEKDPFYQRRKLRQKRVQNSSDESQTGSPRTYRRKSEKTRGVWHKNDHFFSRNIRMYQTEIVPLESDKEQIYYAKCECCCRCRCADKTEILTISPRLPDCNDNVENAGYIIDRLTSLHSGLVLRQDRWAKSPRTPSLSSSTRHTTENN